VAYTTLYQAAFIVITTSATTTLYLPSFTHYIILLWRRSLSHYLGLAFALTFICLLAFILTLMMCDERRFFDA